MTKQYKKLMIGFIGLILSIGLISICSAIMINSVNINPLRISPGESSEIILSIKNNGDNELTDISISLDLSGLPVAPYKSGSQYMINTLDSDKEKEVGFNLKAFNDAKSGIYKIPVIIKYKEDEIIKTESSLISIEIFSKPFIEISYDNGLLIKGEKNTIALKIVNKGLGDAKFLDINLENSNYYNLISSKNIYVGDVDSNDFQTVEYQMIINENSPRNINLPITINYKDIANKEYSENTDIEIKSYTKKQAEDLGLIQRNNIIYIAGIVIFLGIVFFIYRAIRKKIKQK